MTEGVPAAELTVVIPTRDRWDILDRTLGGLARQTVRGFSTIVVVDGHDQAVPSSVAERARVVTVAAGGPGAARNAGVAASQSRLVLLLDDDMVPRPDAIEGHLAAHERHPETNTAVIGAVEWPADRPVSRVARWLDWSGAMFSHTQVDAAPDVEMGWGRFSSCHVSLHKALFEQVGGFDPAFVHYYDDTELAYRLDRAGMVVRYEPRAVTEHHQSFDLAAVERRFARVAIGERLMVEKHPGFAPFFLGKALVAAETGCRWSPAAALVDRIPASHPRRPHWERRADAHHWSKLADEFLASYGAAGHLADLWSYLGDDYDPQLLVNHEAAVHDEEQRAATERDFYRTSRAYLYDLTVFALSRTKAPYLDAVRSLVPSGGRLLDYGCGTGSDGVDLLDAGYDVEFADFDNPSTAFLLWRLARRGHHAAVHDIERSVPAGYDLAFAFDVIEHVEDPVSLLTELERRATVVCVNLLEPQPGDPHLHRALPIDAIIERAERRGLRHRSLHHGRSHLVAYAGDGEGGAP